LTGMLLIRLEICHKSMIITLQGASENLNSQIGKKELTINQELFEILRTELMDSVTDLLGNMKTPTAFDHLAGVAANIMQMREQWRIQKEAGEMNMINNLQPPHEEHGTP
jgi:cob(I)alamin adenosyltransferase